MSRTGVVVFGGSFNPFHVGHLRLAIEVHEAMGNEAPLVELLPCARPPHKKGVPMLDFAFRADTLESVSAAYPWMSCNRMEGEREEYSYTWDTLGLYAERFPDRRVFFLLGSEDYAMLPTWKHGLRLPERCTLLVIPRGACSEDDFAQATRKLWPDASPLGHWGDGCRWGARGGEVRLLPIPWLEISSSRVRELWLAGRLLDGLLPEPVLSALENCKLMVKKSWGR